jgi:hypothetical protein
VLKSVQGSETALGGSAGFALRSISMVSVGRNNWYCIPEPIDRYSFLPDYANVVSGLIAKVDIVSLFFVKRILGELQEADVQRHKTDGELPLLAINFTGLMNEPHSCQSV